MAWILGITCWLILALLLFYFWLCFDYYFFTYDLLEHRAAQWFKYPSAVLAILCLLVSANIVLFAVKIISHRAAAIEVQRASSSQKLSPPKTNNLRGI
jgi:hypothetical protein